MTDAALSASPIKLIHIPTVLGAVVPIFNVPGVSDLKFSGDVLADVFLGKINNWNDARIAKDNPGAKLPDQKIIVVHRSEGSGTSFIFTDYLEQGQQGVGGRAGQRQLPQLAHRRGRQRQ